METAMAAYYQSHIPEAAEKVFSGITFDMYHWPQVLYDGTTTTFEMIKRHDAASIVAIKGDKIVMLKQEQPLRPEYWSVPAGHIEPGEEPHAAAVRELAEETGMTFKTVKLVAVDFIGDNRMEWYVYRYVAYDLESEGELDPGPGEKIEVYEMALAEAQEKARGNVYASPSILLSVDSIENLKALPEVQPLA